jgi:hypothetical protein
MILLPWFTTATCTRRGPLLRNGPCGPHQIGTREARRTEVCLGLRRLDVAAQQSSPMLSHRSIAFHEVKLQFQSDLTRSRPARSANPPAGPSTWPWASRRTASATSWGCGPGSTATGRVAEHPCLPGPARGRGGLDVARAPVGDVDRGRLRPGRVGRPRRAHGSSMSMQISWRLHGASALAAATAPGRPARIATAQRESGPAPSCAGGWPSGPGWICRRRRMPALFTRQPSQVKLDTPGGAMRRAAVQPGRAVRHRHHSRGASGGVCPGSPACRRWRATGRSATLDAALRPAVCRVQMPGPDGAVISLRERPLTCTKASEKIAARRHQAGVTPGKPLCGALRESQSDEDHRGRCGEVVPDACTWQS